MKNNGFTLSSILYVTLIFIGAVVVILGFLKPLLSDFDVDFSNLVVIEKKVVDTVFVEVGPPATLEYRYSPLDPVKVHNTQSTARAYAGPAAGNESGARQNVPIPRRQEYAIERKSEELYTEQRPYYEWDGEGPNPNYSVKELEATGNWAGRYGAIGTWVDKAVKVKKQNPEVEPAAASKPKAAEPVAKTSAQPAPKDPVVQKDVIRMSNPTGGALGTKLDQQAVAELVKKTSSQRDRGQTPSLSDLAPKLEETPARHQEPVGSYEKFSVSELFEDIVLKRAQTPFDYRSRSISGFDMVQVEGGRFVMGATDEQKHFASSDEYPAHVENIKTFLISKYEVTQKQWNELMENNPSRVKGDNYPVESVSPDQVDVFIARLNERTGMKFRLPTEAEWEYAARGGSHSRGYIFSGSDVPEEVLWSRETSDRTLHPVGMLAPNELGLYDMSGNVKEWVLDNYSSYSTTPKDELLFAGNASLKVLRGGSCISEYLDCRVSTRLVSPPSSVFLYTGFRLVCDL